MIYVVKFKHTHGKLFEVKEEEVEADGFKFEGTFLVFVREAIMPGLVGHKEVKLIAAYSEFISIKEKSHEKSK